MPGHIFECVWWNKEKKRKFKANDGAKESDRKKDKTAAILYRNKQFQQ